MSHQYPGNTGYGTYPPPIQGQGQQQYPPQGQQYPPQGQFPPSQGQQQQHQSPYGQYPPQQNQSSPYGQYPPQQQGQQGQYPPSSQFPPQQNINSSNPYGAPKPQTQGYPPQQQSNQYPPQQSPYGQPNPQAYQYGQPPPPQGQGWASSYGNGVPPQEIQQLQMWFSSVDADRSGTISANELATLPFLGKPLGLDTARKLIKVFDKDYTGNIDLNEYIALHQFINKMQNAFFQADQDRSGYLDAKEIFNAITAAGFQLSYPTIQAICQKYDTQRNSQISIEAFIQICAHLASVRSIFEWNDTTKTGKATLSYDQLAHITVHLLDK